MYLIGPTGNCTSLPTIGPRGRQRMVYDQNVQSNALVVHCFHTTIHCLTIRYISNRTLNNICKYMFTNKTNFFKSRNNLYYRFK